MSDEINRTADWEPGTLDKTRKNIGDISDIVSSVSLSPMRSDIRDIDTPPKGGGVSCHRHRQPNVLSHRHYPRGVRAVAAWRSDVV